MTVSEELRLARKKKGLTGPQLAHILNVNQAQVYNWESGQCFPPRRCFKELCRTLGLNPKPLAKKYVLEKNRSFLNM